MLKTELSRKSLAIRVVLGVILAAITFLFFYYFPANLASLASSALPVGNRVLLSQALNGLVSPTLPVIGLVITVLVFVGVIVRGSRSYGAVVLIAGVSFAAYVYVAFQGGTIQISLPKGVTSLVTGTVGIDATTLMLLFLIAPLLTILKGVLLLLLVSKEG